MTVTFAITICNKFIFRLIVWQTATWIKRKFDIDITIKSVGFFSFKEVAIRVSQLQTIVSYLLSLIYAFNIRLDVVFDYFNICKFDAFLV